MNYGELLLVWTPFLTSSSHNTHRLRQYLFPRPTHHTSTLHLSLQSFYTTSGWGVFFAERYFPNLTQHKVLSVYQPPEQVSYGAYKTHYLKHEDRIEGLFTKVNRNPKLLICGNYRHWYSDIIKF